MRLREVLRNAAAALVGLALALGIAEAAIRLFVPLRDLGPSFTVYDPLLGKRNKAGFSAERITPEFRMRLTTNSLGFRGPEPIPGGGRPILFLGDSFTLGYGVNDGEEFPARVALELRRRHGAAAPPVLNAGVGDSGNGAWVKRLRGETARFAPRLVVLQVFDNDFADNVAERLFALEPNGLLRELAVPPPGAARRLQRAIDAIPGLSRSALAALARQALAPSPLPRNAVPGGTHALEPTDGLTLRLVEEAISICRERRWPVLGVLVGLPAAREAAVRERFARQAAPVVSIPSKAERPDLYYAVDGHWHAGGHAFAAGRVLGALDALSASAP